MMTAQGAITEFQNLGYILYLDKGQIKFKCLLVVEPSKDRVAPFLDFFRQNRGAIIEYLKQQKTPCLAYKIYSEVLQSILWVCNTEADRQKLRQQGMTEAIYTGAEIAGLKKLPKDDKGKKALSCIHRIKTVFAGDTKIERG